MNVKWLNKYNVALSLMTWQMTPQR
jgi:hypothetical protein